MSDPTPVPAPDATRAGGPGSDGAASPAEPFLRNLKMPRRTWILGANALFGSAVAGKLYWDHEEAYLRSEAFVARAPSYDGDLVRPLRDGLQELGIDAAEVRGKSILLKPNLVEPSRESPHINTHPLFVRAVAETFRSLGAREVFVAEGQGHLRDTYLVLEQAGLEPILREERLEFVDLNHDEIFDRPNELRFSSLRDLHLPRTLRRADWIVSLPKMKTHHWAGVTLSMKNLFGVMPGICYGWPKNVLHHAGLRESILDITATVRPHLAIVDGIVGMEGDGPIMGTPKPAGVIVMGRNLPAVDATATRVMGLDPWKVWYLAQASRYLGPIAEAHIEQRGENLADVLTQFQLLNHPDFEGYG